MLAQARGVTHKHALGAVAVGWPALVCSWCPRRNCQISATGANGSTGVTKRHQRRMSGPFLRRPQPWIGCQACLPSPQACLRQTSIPICRQATILHFLRCMPIHAKRAARALARGATTETPRASVVLRPQRSRTAPQAAKRDDDPESPRVCIHLARRVGRTATPARHSQRHAVPKH